MSTASSSVVEAQVALSPELDAPVFEDLYRDYFGFAWASLRRLGVANAVIDDAAQDLWVTVHRRLDSYDPTASMKAWIFGIARRVASHYRRSAQRNQRKIAALSIADTRRSDQPIGRREVALTVETFLARLDERKRVAFVLSELEGWSAPEIARVAGTNPNTIYSRIRLAKEQLRDHLRAAEAEADVDRAIDETREATKAPKGAAKHCWVGLLPKLQATSTAATATGFGAALAKIKFAALGAVAGGAALVGVDAALPEDAATSVAAAAPIVQHDTQAPANKATKKAKRSSTKAEAVAPVVEPEPAAAISPAPTVAAPTPTGPRPAPRSAPAAGHSDDTKPAAAVNPAPTETPGLADETVMLTAAKKALQKGNAAEALDLVRSHAKRFPKSRLSDVRSVIEVEALCAAGKRAKARERADAIAAKRPNSSAATRVRDVCKR